jgi:hypothetical protein
MGKSVIAFLAGIAIVMLMMSEIAAVAPTPRPGRLRLILLWCAVPVVILFAAAWLVEIQGLLTQVP